MATQIRTFKVTYADGKGTYTVPVAAASEIAARNTMKAALTEFHAVKEVKHTGFRKIRVVPAEDDSGTVFESEDGKEPIRFDTDHPSQPYLRTYFAKQTAAVDEYLDRRNRGEV